MTINGNQGKAPNYEPNSYQTGPKQLTDVPGLTLATPVSGFTGRFTYELTDEDFVQAGNLYRYDVDSFHVDSLFVVSLNIELSNLPSSLSPTDSVMTPEQRDNLISNIVGHLGNANPTIQQRQVAHFKRADAEYGRRVEEGLAKK